jgi:hypothetical protein
VPQRSKPWCNALDALNLTKDATTKQCEWERGVGELYKGVRTFQSAKREPPNSGMEYLYSPFPLLAVMSKTCTSRTVHGALVDCPRLNSNGKNAKSTTVRGACWATVRQKPADRPRVGRGPSAGPPELHTVLSSFEVNFGPSALDPWTVCPEAILLENLCQKPQILNKTQRPMDCPPHSWKLIFLEIFNETRRSTRAAHCSI